MAHRQIEVGDEILGLLHDYLDVAEAHARSLNRVGMNSSLADVLREDAVQRTLVARSVVMWERLLALGFPVALLDQIVGERLTPISGCPMPKR
jgi:hypothetical protein